MKRGPFVLLVLCGLVLLVAVPGVASAAGYKVWRPSGKTVGRVVPGPVPDQGDRIGVVRDLSRFRGAVYSRQSSSGHWGWPVSNGKSYVAWIKKNKVTRFTWLKVPGGPAVGRVTRAADGKWLAQKKSGGRWVTIGRVQRGCRGQWAAGAARLLLWSR